MNKYIFWLRWNSKFISTDISCPGDGKCSYNGWCNVTNGTCSCYEEFYGNKCQGNIFL